MNNDQNNQNNPSIEEIGEKVIRFGAILVAAAIILFCFAYTKIESPLLQMLAFGLSTLLGCVGIFIIVVIAVGMRAEKHKTNFFLYDVVIFPSISSPCFVTRCFVRSRRAVTLKPKRFCRLALSARRYSPNIFRKMPITSSPQRSRHI